MTYHTQDIEGACDRPALRTISELSGEAPLSLTVSELELAESLGLVPVHENLDVVVNRGQHNRDVLQGVGNLLRRIGLACIRNELSIGDMGTGRPNEHDAFSCEVRLTDNPPEIRVTEAMIEAGVQASCLYDREDPKDWEVAAVYRAMEAVRRSETQCRPDEPPLA